MLHQLSAYKKLICSAEAMTLCILLGPPPMMNHPSGGGKGVRDNNKFIDMVFSVGKSGQESVGPFLHFLVVVYVVVFPSRS